MELLEGIQSRTSIRAFQSKPVPKKLIEQVLRAASRSPSHSNTQPWEVVVVAGKQRDELSKILRDLADKEVPVNPDIPTPPSWPEELQRRREEHMAMRLKLLGIAREDAARRKEMGLESFEFFGAPCVLFLFQDSVLPTWSIFDMGLFSQSIALAAHALGLGTCLQASIARYPDAVREFLGMPKTKRLVLGISIGYPDPKAKINTLRTKRVGQDVFSRWHTA